MISDLNFHLTIRTILQGENFLFSKENEDTYNPTTNGDSFVFFFIFCALAALPTTPVDFFDNSSADCCVEVQVSFDGPKCVDERCSTENAAQKRGVFIYLPPLFNSKS